MDMEVAGLAQRNGLGVLGARCLFPLQLPARRKKGMVE